MDTHSHDAPADRPGANAAAGGDANPVLVELVRGAMVESRHRGAVAVADVASHVVVSVGDIDRPVFARSGLKPLQALALVETGAAAAFALGDAEIALACASHSGETRHVEAVRAWLAGIGLSEDDLECGASLPIGEAARRDLLRAGGGPAPACDNCSGKHAGFLTTARHLGHPTTGYRRLTHPVQQRVLGILEQMTGLDLTEAPSGVDGCGIPVIGIPLGNLALAMARLADPADQPEHRQAACARIRRAMAAEPRMVAGTGRFCTRVIEACGEAALVKTGAEGVFCGALTELGLGVALKVDDGAVRAGEFVTARLLDHLGVLDGGDGDAKRRLADLLAPVVLTRAGEPAGALRAGPGCPF